VAAPTLQAEAAAFLIVQTGACAPTIPTHVADDILLATVMVWVPSTAGVIADIPTQSNWNKLGSVDLNGATKDGQIAWFWRRATASGTTVSFARGAGWDTGTDSAFGARVDVIRGCVTSGNPYDNFQMSTQFTTANQNTPAVTVSGVDRLVMFFEANCVDTTTAQFTARTGFTMGTNRASTGGTGGGARNARLVTGSNVAAAASTHVAPAAGRFYAYAGISFKPPVPTDTSVGEISLESIPEPLTRTDHVLKVRARKSTSAGTVTASAALYEGGSNRSGNLTSSAITTSFVDYALPIADADAEDITSYTNLSIRFWGDSPSGETSSLEISEIWFEAPPGDEEDTTPPVVALTSASTFKMSDESTKDSYSFSFTVDEDCQAWKAKVVSDEEDTHDAGTEVESGGAATSAAAVTGSITYAELVAAGMGAEGNKILKFFAQDTAGNWST